MAGSSKKKSAKSTPAKRAPRSASAAKKVTAKRTRTKTSSSKATGLAKRATTKAAAKKRARGSVTGAAKPRAAAKAISATTETPAPRAVSELTRRMVAAAVAACEEKKGTETRLLELDAADAGLTDFFLITSGTNERQTQSIADEIELRLKREFNTYPNSVEGKRQGEWVLLDYVDFVVHVFLEEKRAFYDIERLRKSARTVDLTQLEQALSEKTASSRSRTTSRRSE